MEVVSQAEENNVLVNLEDDLEFEEFDVEEWSEDEKDKEDLNLWDEDWDDDDLEDDFSVQLRAELSKVAQQQSMNVQ
ncbi:hypothetical protein BB559_000539 [Furculomyces boomerangus]|uniref:26S proteasome complex subunit SEM1 n=1 Tax=Furculomyces boomerangus TaxID=61424 RepID=A0A2T9Z511_9FUNG|nr:hypothetical protein BB559_000539 [Furculomyces boomerangus]